MSIPYFPEGDFGPVCDTLVPFVSSGNPSGVGEPVDAPPAKPTCPIVDVISQYRPVGMMGPICDISWPDIDPNCLSGDPKDPPSEERVELVNIPNMPFDDPTPEGSDKDIKFWQPTIFGTRCKYDAETGVYYDCKVTNWPWDPCVIHYGKNKGLNICDLLEKDFGQPPTFRYAKPPWNPRYCVDFDPPENLIEFDNAGNPTRYIVYPRSEPTTYGVQSMHWHRDVNNYAVWVNPMICNLHGATQIIEYKERNKINFPAGTGTVMQPKSNPESFAVEHPAWSNWLNDYAVFIEPGNTSTNWNGSTWELQWVVDFGAGGAHIFRFAADNTAQLYLNNSPIGQQFHVASGCSGTSCWNYEQFGATAPSGKSILKARVTNYNDGPEWQSNPTCIGIEILTMGSAQLWHSRMGIGKTSVTTGDTYTMLVAADDDIQVLIDGDNKITSTGCSACHNYDGNVPASMQGIPTSLQIWDPITSTWENATTGVYPLITTTNTHYYDSTLSQWHTFFTANPSKTFIECLCVMGPARQNASGNDYEAISAGARGLYICNGCTLDSYDMTTINTGSRGTGLNGKVTVRADRILNADGTWGARVYLSYWSTFGYNYRVGDVYQLIYTDADGNDISMGYCKVTSTTEDSFNIRNSVDNYITVDLPEVGAGAHDMEVQVLNVGGFADNWKSFYPSNNLGEYDLQGMSVVAANGGPVQNSDELRGFDIPGDGWRYLMTGTYDANFVANRSAKFALNTVGSPQIRIWARAGNDSNGHERPNESNEGLKLEIDAGTGIKREVQLLPSWKGSGKDSATYDSAYGGWTTYTTDLNSDEQVGNCIFTVKSKADNPPEFKTAGTSVSFNAQGDVIVTGDGEVRVTFTYDQNDDPNAHGTALSGTGYRLFDPDTNAVKLQFTQGPSTKKYDEYTITLQGGKTYPADIVIGWNPAPGQPAWENSNNKLCLYDSHETDCNVSIRIANVDTISQSSAYETIYANAGDIYGIYRVDLGGSLSSWVGDQPSNWATNPACWAIKLYKGEYYYSPPKTKVLALGIHQFHPNRQSSRNIMYRDGQWNGSFIEHEHGNDVFTTTAATNGTCYEQDFTLGEGGLKIRVRCCARCGNSNCSEADSKLAIIDILEQGYGYVEGDEFPLTWSTGDKSGSFSDWSVYIAEVELDAEDTGNMFWHTRKATGYDKVLDAS